MRGVLSADQRAKLQQIMDRADADRRKSSDPKDSKDTDGRR